jgi:hypothetical protein
VAASRGVDDDDRQLSVTRTRERNCIDDRDVSRARRRLLLRLEPGEDVARHEVGGALHSLPVLRSAVSSREEEVVIAARDGTRATEGDDLLERLGRDASQRVSEETGAIELEMPDALVDLRAMAIAAGATKLQLSARLFFEADAPHRRHGRLHVFAPFRLDAALRRRARTASGRRRQRDRERGDSNRSGARLRVSRSDFV